MLPWRSIIGILSLVIASAGPMPLWLHQAVHHAAGGCYPSAHCPANHTHSQSTDDGHLEEGHVDECHVAHSDSHLETDSHAHDLRRDTAYLSSAGHSHDCGVCYQLSQASSVAVEVGQHSSALAAIRLAISPRQFVPATICTLCAPRGPPAAAAA